MPPPWPEVGIHVLEVFYRKHLRKVFISLSPIQMGLVYIEVSNQDRVYSVWEVAKGRCDVICLGCVT